MNQQTRSLDPLAEAQSVAPLVRREDRDDVALLLLAAPDGNRMGPALIAALSEALNKAIADPTVSAITLATLGRDFCAGAYDDLPPPGPDPLPAPKLASQLASLCTLIADSPKPIACALRGRVAAGGLAVALAARDRIAAPDTVFLSPELGRGRLPAGGAAIRLGWLLGAQPTLDFLRGQPIPTERALTAGLIDGIEAETVTAALTRARNLTPKAAAQPGLSDGPAYAQALRLARQSLPKPLPPHRQAEAWLIEAMEAAQLLAPDQALAFDLVRAEDAARLPVARALAHQARASRRAFEPAPRPAQGPIAVALTRENAARQVPVLLREGARVILLGDDRAALSGTLEAIAGAQMALVRAGRLTQEQASADWARLGGRLSLDPGQPPGVGLADAAHLDWLAPQLPALAPLALWAPDGSREQIAGLARHNALRLVPAATRPARLCEVVSTPDTPRPMVDAVAALVLQMRLSPLLTHKAPILTALIRASARAAGWLGAAGVSGPALAATGLLPEGLGDPDPGPAPTLPLSVDRLILLAVVAEGLRLLADGRVARPSDLDLAMVMGAGWPHWRGGPMAEADSLGPMVLRHELRLAATLDAELWAPAPILDEMIRRGWRFEDLNAG
ncbi:enoyl-CoA hydratase/isomerase family protein [Cereibacter sphaeroides]|nr:enoyl-CoA hydratase/isomerase family protein [Cereibacter sphaeroides]